MHASAANLASARSHPALRSEAASPKPAGVVRLDAVCRGHADCPVPQGEELKILARPYQRHEGFRRPERPAEKVISRMISAELKAASRDVESCQTQTCRRREDAYGLGETGLGRDPHS